MINYLHNRTANFFVAICTVTPVLKGAPDLHYGYQIALWIAAFMTFDYFTALIKGRK